MQSKSVMRKFDSKVASAAGYIGLLLSFSEIRLSNMLLKSLAYVAIYGKLTREQKELLAEECSTDLQTVANALTKLRKLGLIQGNEVDKRLALPESFPFKLVFIINEK